MEEVRANQERALLLSVLALRRRDHPARWAVGTAALGVTNLFFCAYAERFIDDPADTSALLLLLAVESCFFLITVAAVFLGEMEAILRKTSLLPVPVRSRYTFALIGLTRHPAVLVLWGSAVFALAAVGPATWFALPARVLLVLLLGALILTCFCTALFLATRNRSGASRVIAVTMLLLLGAAFWSATTSAEPLLAAVLPLRWTVDGIIAAQSGDIVRCIVSALLLALPTAGCLLWGRWRA